MTTKHCSACQQSRPLADFNIRRASADGLQNICRSCNRAKARRYNPCIDCGESDLRVLDFDHRPEVAKRADVMKLVQDGYSIARVMDEIAKCDVRCRNCHAKVT